MDTGKGNMYAFYLFLNILTTLFFLFFNTPCSSSRNDFNRLKKALPKLINPMQVIDFACVNDSSRALLECLVPVLIMEHDTILEKSKKKNKKKKKGKKGKNGNPSFQSYGLSKVVDPNLRTIVSKNRV